MQITIATIGKAKSGPEQALVDEYIKRNGWPVQFSYQNVKKRLSGEALKQAEAELLLGVVKECNVVIALDERGKSMGSAAFSQWMDARMMEGQNHFGFVIGGADGLDRTVRQKASLVLSFGQMTWPHAMVRAMLAEQLYRAWALSTGHPYHRE